MEFLGLNAPINVAAVSGFYASFSPDGRWLAYNSTQSGSQEISSGRIPMAVSSDRFRLEVPSSRAGSAQAICTSGTVRGGT
jgi:Tol biopolymer transport system component